jgi:hypothetical protein
MESTPMGEDIRKALVSATPHAAADDQMAPEKYTGSTTLLLFNAFHLDADLNLTV